MKQERDIREVARNVARLSHLLTIDRDGLAEAYLADPGLRQAYVDYFLPANRAKISRPLTDLALHPSGIVNTEKLRILDLGAGPGTAVLGIMDFFAGRSARPFLEFTALDQVQENLALAAALFRDHDLARSGSASLKTAHGRIQKTMISGRFDIIVCANAMNEFFYLEENRIEKRIHFLQRLLNGHLTMPGSCILIEPALRDTSRELLMVRDGLRKAGLHIYSPCLIQEPCPALLNPKDWCHEEMGWERPDGIRRIDEAAGLRKESLKFSYLVIRNDGASLSDSQGSASYRVVSELIRSKGKIEFYLCGNRGRKLAVRLDRDKTSLNDAVDGLRRGDIAAFSELRDENRRLKVLPESETVVLPQSV